ncbi:hypothetical protein AT6N2_C3520 [Agrobacterium tumefaciens]|nr:hypothetical protein AT6N2_C3520 [Agrobacterium tumefaciens]
MDRSAPLHRRRRNIRRAASSGRNWSCRSAAGRNRAGRKSARPRRRNASFQPPFAAGAQPDIKCVGDAGHDDHAEGERVTEMRIAKNVAADLRKKQDRHDIERGAGQRDSGRDGAEGVGEKQRHGSEQRGQQDREGHHAPILKTGRAENFRSLAPFAFQAVKRRGDDEDHQRNLEEQIGDRQAPERQDVEAKEPQVNADLRLQKDCQQTDRAERCDERKGKRHAGKLRGDAGKSEKWAANALRQTAEHHGCGHGKADQTTECGRGETDLYRDPVGRKDGGGKKSLDVFQRESAVCPLKCANDDLHRRHDQKQQHKNGKRYDAYPMQRQLSARVGWSGGVG